MSVFNKIKGVGARLLADDTAFYSAIVILVAVSSFGLGRQSAIDSNEPTSLISPLLASSSTQKVQVVTTVIKSDLVSGETAPAPARSDLAGAGDGAVTYVGSKNSDKYHLPWCSGAKTIAEQNKVYFKSKAEAEAAGYKPAGNCKGI